MARSAIRAISKSALEFLMAEVDVRILNWTDAYECGYIVQRGNPIVGRLLVKGNPPGMFLRFIHCDEVIS